MASRKAPKLKKLSIQFNRPDGDGTATWKTDYTIFTNDGQEISSRIQVRGDRDKLVSAIVSKSNLPSGSINAIYLFASSTFVVRNPDGTKEFIE